MNDTCEYIDDDVTCAEQRVLPPRKWCDVCSYDYFANIADTMRKEAKEKYYIKR